MINRGSEKISCEEVEDLVYRYDSFDLAAAVAMLDPVFSERVCVYVSLKEGGPLGLERIRAAIESAGVAKHKHPERLIAVDDMPLTKVGKIDKRERRGLCPPRQRLMGQTLSARAATRASGGCSPRARAIEATSPR